MITTNFRVSLHGINSRDIVDYATTHTDCGACGAALGYPCIGGTDDRPTCKERYTAAVKMLAGIAESAVRAELEDRRSEGIRIFDTIADQQDNPWADDAIGDGVSGRQSPIDLTDDPWAESDGRI